MSQEEKAHLSPKQTIIEGQLCEAKGEDGVSTENLTVFSFVSHAERVCSGTHPFKTLNSSGHFTQDDNVFLQTENVLLRNE